MNRIEMMVRPKENFNVPASDGYQLYSALLSLIKNENPELSKEIHDLPINTISISGIIGKFKKSNRDRTKVLLSDSTYKIEIGLTNDVENEFFDSFVIPIILNNKSIELKEGVLLVEEISTSELLFEDLLQSIKPFKNPVINFNFITPACIQYRNSKITEMYPHRIAVFNSLLSKWNNISTQKYPLGINRDEMGRYITESPDFKSIKTFSVLTNTVFDSKSNHPRPIFKQGFIGNCQYRFCKNAPESFKNGILALSLFSEYSGVGSSVARGCGKLKVSITESA